MKIGEIVRVYVGDRSYNSCRHKDYDSPFLEEQTPSTLQVNPMCANTQTCLQQERKTPEFFRIDKFQVNIDNQCNMLLSV